MVDDKFKCEQKIQEYAKRSTYEKAKMLVQTANGCGVIHEDVKYEIDSIGYRSCLCSYLHPSFNTFLFLFKNYEKGILPFKGALGEQPAYIIDVFSMLENLKNDKLDQDRQREEKRNNK